MTDPAGSSEPARPLFTLRTFILFAGAGALLLVAVIERSSVPLMAALVVLLAPVAAGLDSPRPPVRARLMWEAGGGASDVNVTGRLVLPSSVSPADTRLELPVTPPLMRRQPSTERIVKDTLEFAAFWSAPLPLLVQVPVPQAGWTDPLELVELPLRVDGTPLSVERFPPEALQLTRIRLRRTTAVPGEVRARQVGETGEFFAVREALATDPLRRINWTATARVGRRMANEFVLERTGDIVLLVDARPTPLGPVIDRTLVSLECVAALGIASGLLREKARVGLGVFDEFLKAVPLGSGRVQRTRIAALLRDTPVGKAPGPSERFAISVRRYFPSGVSTLVLSPLLTEESANLLTHLRRRGFAPIVLSPSSLPLTESRPGGPAASDPLARRLALALRRTEVSELWAQAPVVDWEDYWTLAPLVRLLRAPIRNRGAA